MSDYIEEARKLGRDHGAAAGTWAADGNTTDHHRRSVLRMLADGDPAADDYLPTMPNLSGQWADDLTPAKLYEEITGNTAPDASDLMEALSDAYEEGVLETFTDACERELRAGLSEEAI